MLLLLPAVIFNKVGVPGHLKHSLLCNWAKGIKRLAWAVACGPGLRLLIQGCLIIVLVMSLQGGK